MKHTAQDSDPSESATVLRNEWAAFSMGKLGVPNSPKCAIPTAGTRAQTPARKLISIRESRRNEAHGEQNRLAGLATMSPSPDAQSDAARRQSCATRRPTKSMNAPQRHTLGHPLVPLDAPTRHRTSVKTTQSTAITDAHRCPPMHDCEKHSNKSAAANFSKIHGQTVFDTPLTLGFFRVQT